MASRNLLTVGKYGFRLDTGWAVNCISIAARESREPPQVALNNDDQSE